VKLVVKTIIVILCRVADCEELVGKVNHSTECVTDFFNCWKFSK